MRPEKFSFDYEVYEGVSSLSEADRKLFENAKAGTSNAYAPYSQFRVAAAAELENGEVICGVNIENASFPAGLCAEGSTLAMAASRYPGVPIRTMAISYVSEGESNHPVAPCGICRQQLQEFSERTKSPIRLLLGGSGGQIIVVADASSLLPFSFKF